MNREYTEQLIETTYADVLAMMEAGQDKAAVYRAFPEYAELVDDMYAMTEGLHVDAVPSRDILSAVFAELESARVTDPAIRVTDPAQDRFDTVTDAGRADVQKPFFVSFINALSMKNTFAWSAAIVILLAVGVGAYMRFVPGQRGFDAQNTEIADATFEENDFAELDMLADDSLDLENGLLALADLTADIPQSSALNQSGSQSFTETSSELNSEYDTLLNDFQEIETFNSSESDVEGDLDTLS